MINKQVSAVNAAEWLLYNFLQMRNRPKHVAISCIQMHEILGRKISQVAFKLMQDKLDEYGFVLYRTTSGFGLHAASFSDNAEELKAGKIDLKSRPVWLMVIEAEVGAGTGTEDEE